MAGEDELIDVPIVWENTLVSPVVEREEPREDVAFTNDALFEEESDNDMAEVTGFVMLNRVGLVTRLKDLKRKIHKIKSKARMLQFRIQLKKEEEIRRRIIAENQVEVLKLELKEKKEQSDLWRG